MTDSVAQNAVERIYREESGRILATLIRAVQDFDLAEEALQDALAKALERWPVDGLPANAGAWITVAARNSAIDKLRRSRAARTVSLHDRLPEDIARVEHDLDTSIEDDRLRLIFTCCHPALNTETQVALTLRTLGGLTTPEIARAFLVPLGAVAQRLVRGKRKIKQANIPYRVPPDHLLPERLPGVLAVVYLIFNEGYAASASENLIREELCNEALRLARLLAVLMPDEPEVLGLWALVLLHDSRRQARISGAGDLILLEDQDRTLWDRVKIREGRLVLERALRHRRPGTYQLQAAIAALHAEAPNTRDTDWAQIAALYEALMTVHPSPVIALNRAVAVAFEQGWEQGLMLIDGLGRDGTLDRYLYYHAARADLLRRLGRNSEAREAYRLAVDLTGTPAEREFLLRRMAELA